MSSSNAPLQWSGYASCWKAVSGLVLQDDPKNNVYPMPLLAKHRDEVFVGRLRRDESIANGLNMWVVSDNLRKGAANQRGANCGVPTRT